MGLSLSIGSEEASSGAIELIYETNRSSLSSVAQRLFAGVDTGHDRTIGTSVAALTPP